jgi:hypothetical protein
MHIGDEWFDFGGIIGKILLYTGAWFLWMLGACQKDFEYYIELENYGFLPHLIGLIFWFGVVVLLFKLLG